MRWYTGDVVYDSLLAFAMAFAVSIAIGACFVDAPYGRFASTRFGAALNPRLGWFLMELPATVVFLVIYFSGSHRFEAVPLFFLGIWLLHYGNRGFYFPLRLRVERGATARFGWLVVISGWLVTGLHGYLNAAFFSELGGHYSLEWFRDPRFVIGVLLYLVSLAFNIHSDGILRNLRTPEELVSGKKIYRIPKGGLFEYVSCPSYTTEILAWIGFALATWSLGAVFVLIVSMANLIPRAIATHRWYLERFPDYPPSRKILVPFLW